MLVWGQLEGEAEWRGSARCTVGRGGAEWRDRVTHSRIEGPQVFTHFFSLPAPALFPLYPASPLHPANPLLPPTHPPGPASPPLPCRCMTACPHAPSCPTHPCPLHPHPPHPPCPVIPLMDSSHTCTPTACVPPPPSPPPLQVRDSLATVCRQLGVQVRTGCQVVSIDTQQGPGPGRGPQVVVGVTLKDGEKLAANIVVSNR